MWYSKKSFLLFDSSLYTAVPISKWDVVSPPPSLSKRQQRQWIGFVKKEVIGYVKLYVTKNFPPENRANVLGERKELV